MRSIDADAFRNEWLCNGLNEKVYDTNDFLDSIDGQPTIDPVKHGYWETYTDYDDITRHRCSECKANIPVVLVRASTYECPYGLVEEIEPTPHCPNCGAIMDAREASE